MKLLEKEKVNLLLSESLPKKRKENNQEHVKNLWKKKFRKQKAKNPKRIREINKQAFRKRKRNNHKHIKEMNRNCKKRAETATRTPFNAVPSIPQLICSSDQVLPPKNNFEIIRMINMFLKNIACGPEYVCTCGDQMWYKCSVVRCDAQKYKACTPELVESCVTGVNSVDNTEWIA